jgi:rod shape-determining protein MreD
MRILKITLLILGSVILQITLIARVPVFGNRPDLPLALVVSVALFKGPLHGELVGFASGLLCDLLSDGQFLGIQSFSKTVIGYSTGLVRGRLYSENLITQSVSGLIATVVAKFITSIHLSLLLTDAQFLRIRFSGLILAAILNAILTIAAFWVVKRSIKSVDRSRMDNLL